MTARKNVSTGQDVTSTAPDGTTAAGAPAPAPAEGAVSVAPVDAPEAAAPGEDRAAKLEALLNGTEADAPVQEQELDYNPEQDPIDFGGRVVCVVTFSRWNALVKGLYKSARKGVLVKVTADAADRGERLGGLRRVDVD